MSYPLLSRSAQARRRLAREETRLRDTRRRSASFLISVAAPSVRSTRRSEEHTSELQSLMRISYAVFCLKQKNNIFFDLYQSDFTLNLIPTIQSHIPLKISTI